MQGDVRITHHPVRPLLIFDGDCGFCRMWIARWRQLTGGKVDYLPSQSTEVREAYPEIPVEWYGQSVVLVQPDGTLYRGAEAALRSLAGVGARYRMLVAVYESFPPFRWLAETFYKVVARNRGAAAGLTRLLWFGQVQLPSLTITRCIFLRGLGIIYLAAFASFLVQVSGLVGEKGILPARDYFQAASEQLGAGGWLQLPSIFWFTGAGDVALRGACLAGMGAALLLLLGAAQPLTLFVCWLLYLSLSIAGQVFLQFQWDLLLLETGLLAVLLAPATLRPKLPRNEGEPSHLVVWLLRWLMFRLMFQSGLVKLLYEDETWRNLTALAYHYQTQPIPNAISWYAHRLPLWFHKWSTLGMFAIELAVAFLALGPRGLRAIAAVSFALLQVGILLTGNYGYFNLLSILLCVPLLDDFFFPRRWGGKRLWKSPEHCVEQLGSSSCGIPTPSGQLDELAAPAAQNPTRRSRQIPRWIVYPTGTLIFLVTLVLALAQLGSADKGTGWTHHLAWPARHTPRPLLILAQAAQSFRSTNSYGLFATMTLQRPEITIEGSNTGAEWRPYVFRYKPGPLHRAPPYFVPHMPRLDWQMWFAALGSIRNNPWFISFLERLLTGEPIVLALLESNPFPDSPPRYIRARVQNYEFTSPAERTSSGNWWKPVGPVETYCPTLTLEKGNVGLAHVP